MSDKNSSGNDDYEVGFGKPPMEHQFKRGRSGNPKGRKAGEKNTKTILKRALNSRVSVTEGGKRRSLTKHEVLIMAQLNKGLKGDTRAFKEIMNLAEKYGLADEVEAGLKRLIAEDTAILDAYIKRAGKTDRDDGE